MMNSPCRFSALLLLGSVVVSDRGHGPAGVVAPFHHPHDVCSAVALSPGFPEDPTVFAASYGSMNLFLRSRNRGFGWKNQRSGMLGHKISDCEMPPDWQDSQLVYVALGEAGLQRSSDGGDSWQPPLLREAVHQVEVAQLHEGRRIVLCGGERAVWQSADGGETFDEILQTDSAVSALAIPDSFVELPVVAVGTAAALHMRDASGGWHSVKVPSPVRTLEFSPAFAVDSTLWVGTLGHGLMKSEDGGKSLVPVGGLQTAFINDVAVAPTWPQCKDLYAATPRDGVHVSRDGGQKWERLTMHVVETYQSKDHYQSLAISPNYPADPTIYCGAYEGLYCSIDAGQHWFELVLNPTRIGRKVAVSPQYADDGHVFMVGYGNPFVVSGDRGETWEFRSRGIRTMGAYSISPSPQFQEDGIVLVGMGSGIRRTTDFGATWAVHPLKPVSPWPAIGSYETRQIEYSRDFAEDRVAFALNAGGFFRSNDAGETWSGHGVPFDWTWRFAVAPDSPNHQTVFLGGYSVWRSDNGGADWKRLTSTGKVLGLICAPDFASTREVYLVSESRGLLISKDGGETWKESRGSFEGFSPTKLRLSKTFEKDGLMVVSTVSGGMFLSADRGVTWKRCAPLGCPADAAFDFALSPEFAQDGTMFCCTYNGIARTTDFGATWTSQVNTELYDDERDPWLLRGDWSRSYSTGFFGVGAHYADAEGAEGVLPFTGTGIRVYGMAGPDHGKCEVFLDGKSAKVVDCYSADVHPDQLLFAAEGLEQGFHNVRIRVLGESHPDSTGTLVTIDGATADYSSDDENNPLFAQLNELYLGPNVSHGRDTLSQNHEVDRIREEIRSGQDAGTGDADGSAQTKDAELAARMSNMREALRRLKEEADRILEQVDELDKLIAAREQLLRSGAGSGKK